MRFSSSARSIQPLLAGLLISVVVVVLPFAWILRDGLGPESVRSSGADAVWRCLRTFHIGFVLLVLGLLLIGARILSRRHPPKP